MKFDYEYRTSENVRQCGVIRAANRDAAFAALKARGIRPSAVRETPGLANKLFGKGKRWIAIGVLGVGCVVLGAGVVFFRDAALSTTRQPSDAIAGINQRTRRQPIGDTAVIEKGIRTGWAEVFPEEGERFLASFAVPGVPAGLRNTSEREIQEALAREVGVAPSDSIEVRQIKAMVEGMKDELRQFLADGGTIVEYGRRLVMRQEQEIGYYSRAKAEIESAHNAGASPQEVEALWEKRNNSLRRMGIRLISLPE